MLFILLLAMPPAAKTGQGSGIHRGLRTGLGSIIQDARMTAVEFPGDVGLVLDRLRDALRERPDLIGIYLYGSLVTGDFSPARSDIDVLVMPSEPGAPEPPGSCTVCTSPPSTRPTRTGCAHTGSGTG
jgi:hypothetical protein